MSAIIAFYCGVFVGMCVVGLFHYSREDKTEDQPAPVPPRDQIDLWSTDKKDADTSSTNG